MKHLKKFEHYNQTGREHYNKIISTKQEFSNTSTFKKQPENEQEVLSNVYSEESEVINKISQESIQEDFALRGYWNTPKESIDLKVEQLKKTEECSRLTDEIGKKLRELGFGFKIYKLNSEAYPINKLTESIHSVNANRDYDEVYKLLAQYFKASFDGRVACRTYNKL